MGIFSSEWYYIPVFLAMGLIPMGCGIYFSYRTYRRTNGKHVLGGLPVYMVILGVLPLWLGVEMLLAWLVFFE